VRKQINLDIKNLKNFQLRSWKKCRWSKCYIWYGSIYY